jgi:predicted RNA-binding Zn ribbon-like protein
MTFSWNLHRFVGGALALDVANSVILRFDSERSIDRFAAPGHLEGFARAAEAFSAERALFGELAPMRRENLPRFLALREAVDRYFRGRVLGEETPLLLADLLEATAAVLRYAERGSLDAATAHSAVRLLAAEEVSRLKICGHCGWLFLDRSRNRSRAWCDMAVCGNRVKAGRHYRRKKEDRP